MRKRKIPSPDEADALSFTFANPVASGNLRSGARMITVDNAYCVQ
jgi:hypothetical protein